MIDWLKIATQTVRELGSPAGRVDVTKAPGLVKLCGPDRRLSQSGTAAQFQGGLQRPWLAFLEMYDLRAADLASLATPRAIVDHILMVQVPAAQALIEKIEAHIVAGRYDLDRTRCIALQDWWMRQAVDCVPGKEITVSIDCFCAFGPWIPPVAADEPAIAGKAGA